MPHCILFFGEEVVARGNGDWVRQNEIRIVLHIGAADQVSRMLIDNVNYRVIAHYGFIYSVVYDPIPEH